MNTGDGVTLGDVLAQFPDEERVLLSLHYLQGLAPDQIAAQLGVPLKSVESVLASGRVRLLTALGLGS